MVSINEVERLFNEALDYINISSFEKAEIKLEKAYKLLPKKISIILNLSSVLINLKKLDKAYSILNLGIEEHPKNTDILLNIATILMLKKKFSEAIEIVNQIKEIDPKINATSINPSRGCNALTNTSCKPVVLRISPDNSGNTGCSEFALNWV